MRYLLGLDLGQANDYTAVAILDRRVPTEELEQIVIDPVSRLRYKQKATRQLDPIYALRYLERMRDEPYPKIVSRVAALIQRPELKGQTKLVVDGTGVGRAVVDMLQDAHLHPVAIAIHGGDTVTIGGSTVRTPKRDLVGVVQVLLQTDRLVFAEDLKLLDVLKDELRNFTVKIDPITAHDSYSAWREGDHDDLVLAVATAAWYGEWFQGPTTWTPVSRSYVSL